MPTSTSARMRRVPEPRSDIVNGIACILRITLEPTASGGTRLTSRGTWSANGLARLFFPIFIRTMRKAEVQVVAHARRALEAHEDMIAA